MMWNMIDMLIAATGAAVLHFLWQGVLIGIVAAVALRLLRAASCSTRYGVSVLLLGLCAATFVGTFAVGLRGLEGGDIGGFIATLDAAKSDVVAGASSAWTIGPLIDGAGWFWAVGVACFAVRSFGCWIGARRLRTWRTSPPDAPWASEFASLRASFGVRPSVRLLRSGAAEAPMVVGCLAPVVLVPAAAFISLTPEQLRAVLAHELAHIRRADHLVNAGQIVIETVLFFHPVVWLLSKRIRIEREHCCDDAAVRASGSPLIFAGALAQLESLRTVHPHAALAANGGSLMHRIVRILGASPRPAARPGLRSAASVLAVAAVIAGAGLVSAAGVKASSKPDPVVEALRDAVASGVMTAEEARRAYDAVASLDAEMRRAVEEKLASQEARVRAAVEAGTLSPAEAEEKIAALEREMARHTEMTFSMDVLGLTKGEAYLATVRADIAEKVRAGALTEADAAAWMEKAEASVNIREEYAEYVRAAEAKIRAAIEAGEITPEEGRRKMVDVKQGVEMRMHYHAVSQRIKAAVERGDMTPEAGEAKLADLKREMAAKRDGDRNKADAQSRRIAGALMETGVPRESVRDVMGVLRKIVGEVKAEGDAFEVDPEIRAHLKELGLDDGQIRTVIDIARRVASAGERDANVKRGVDWDSIQRRLDAAVERGDMTQNEADAKLAVLRREMEAKLEAESRRAIDWDAATRRIEAAVERGDMTRDEADAAYKRLKGEMRGDR